MLLIVNFRRSDQHYQLTSSKLVHLHRPSSLRKEARVQCPHESRSCDYDFGHLELCWLIFDLWSLVPEGQTFRRNQIITQRVMSKDEYARDAVAANVTTMTNVILPSNVQIEKQSNTTVTLFTTLWFMVCIFFCHHFGIKEILATKSTPWCYAISYFLEKQGSTVTWRDAIDRDRSSFDWRGEPKKERNVRISLICVAIAKTRGRLFEVLRIEWR